jgi:hypothetical protein
VQALLDARLDELVGDDIQRELEPVQQVRAGSRRALARFIDAAAPVVGAWCFREKQVNPWTDGSLAVLKTIDQQGLLDFATVEPDGELTTVVRAKCWPAGMPQTVDATALGLDPDDLRGEKQREQDRKDQVEAERRTISFGSIPLDTRAREFARSLTDLAEASMADGEWLTRSRRRFNLVEQAQSETRRGEQAARAAGDDDPSGSPRTLNPRWGSQASTSQAASWRRSTRSVSMTAAGCRRTGACLRLIGTATTHSASTSGSKRWKWNGDTR